MQSGSSYAFQIQREIQRANKFYLEDNISIQLLEMNGRNKKKRDKLLSGMQVAN
jgi:hypothetical protein